jgi:hypothetical protein
MRIKTYDLGKSSVDVVLTDYGITNINPKTLEAYTGCKSVDEVWAKGKGMMARRKGLKQLENDVICAARLVWRQGKDPKKA